MEKSIKTIILILSLVLFSPNNICAIEIIGKVGGWTYSYGEDDYYETDPNTGFLSTEWLKGRDKDRELKMGIIFSYFDNIGRYMVMFLFTPYWVWDGELDWDTISLRDDESGTIYSNIEPKVKKPSRATFFCDNNFFLDYLRRGNFTILLKSSQSNYHGNAVFKVSSYDVREFDEAVKKFNPRFMPPTNRTTDRNTAYQNTPARNSVPSSSGFKKLTGSIGKYGVTMNLDLANKKGTHFYNSRPSSVFQLQFVAKNCISDDGYGNAIYDVVIREIWQEKPTGTYEGRITMKNNKITQFSGKFTNSKATVFDFTLKEL